MIRLPAHNCIYFTEWRYCNHLERRGTILSKGCILDQKFVAECKGRIKHKRPPPPPPPPSK